MKESFSPKPVDIDNITKQIGTGIDNIKVFENYLTDKESETAMSIISSPASCATHV